MSLRFQPAAARLPASFADPALIGANDDRTWLAPSQRHCAHAAWKKAGYGALKARAPSLLRPKDNASFARLSGCGLVASEGGGQHRQELTALPVIRPSRFR